MTSVVPGGYTLPGSGIYPEGLAFDPRTLTLFTTGMLQGTVFRTTIDQPSFGIFSPAGSNGLTSSTGLRLDEKSRRLVVCGGVTGLAHVFDVDTGDLLGRYTNGLVESVPDTMAPNAQAPTFVNDVAFIGSDAYLTDSYDPVLYRLTGAAMDAGTRDGLGKLDRWLPFDDTPIRYQDDGTVPGRFNLNGIVATPDERFLLVIQTNTGKLFRIDVAERHVIEIKGEGNPGGDGLIFLSATDVLSIDMTKQPTLTRLHLSAGFDAYEVVGQYNAPGNISPTAGLVEQDFLLLTESQISDVLLTKEPEHLPFRVSVHLLSAVGD